MNDFIFVKLGFLDYDTIDIYLPNNCHYLHEILVM